MFNQKNYEIEINDALATILSKYVTTDSSVKASMVYSLLDGGKRIRPLLYNLILEAYNIDYKDTINAACAIEMIHTYSLVHDDLPAMDNDVLRRGKPTTHVRFNEALAILCGDALLNDAFGVVANLDIDSQDKIEIIKILSSKAGSNGMIYGQDLDMFPDQESSLDDILKTYYYKTCCLIQASMMMAAVVAKKDINDFEKMGEYLGLAFQVQDDILEYTQTSEQIGKDTSSDEKNNKVTVVSLIGLEKAQEKVDYYFNEIDSLLEKLSLKDTNFHQLIDNIASRKK